ncbi:MAG: hypothetical protein QGG39_06185 [Candidatus Poribacteria bacterium]|nr:hypothetical protein [Candidatus Poribacteria bacterium]
MLRLNFTVEPVMITGRIGDLILAYQPAVLATCSNAYTNVW